MKRKLTLAVMTLLLTIGSAVASATDSVIFTLSNPDQSTEYPGTLTYTATVTAAAGNSAPIFLNGTSFNVAAPVTLDSSDFFTNYPYFLDPGQSFTGDLFTLDLPAGILSGIYPGTFTLLGGADGNAGDNLGVVQFTANVTPEPSSLVLLGTGMASAFAAIKRKRFTAI